MSYQLNSDSKIGILGGGQLGKMLCLAGGNWHLPLHVLDVSDDFPSAPFATRFVEGDFKDYDDVYSFGMEMDVLTIEIEHVNTKALHQLEKEGVTIHPAPAILDIIKDKGLQKEFYQKNGIPTSSFELYEDAEAVRSAIQAGNLSVPFVQKSRTAGYDGRGVEIIKTDFDLKKLLPGPCVIEELIDMDKELAVIVAQNENEEISAFPCVEMEFNPVANLVEYLLCPARIDQATAEKAEKLAIQVAKTMGVCGLLAVELFLTKEGDILVNEVAPRPHNSGHHTIDSCYTSQFEQHLRAILNWPLGSTKMKTPSVMVNLLGEDGYKGNAYYEGLENALQVEGAKFHLYGKTQTRPYRKMGHVTVVDKDLDKAREKAEKVKNAIRIITE